jgi:uncharacterized coiled-coil protein SlyX
MEKFEKRITSLEEVLAHAVLNNEELSNELLHANKKIEALERKVFVLESRFVTLEDNLDAPPEDTKPPHW